MSSEPEQSVLRRMVAPPRLSSTQQGGGAEDVHIQVQFPRVADTLLGLSVEVTSVSRQKLSQQEVVSAVEASDLVYSLVGAEGRLGVAVVDAMLLSALIEVQTTGRVSHRPPPERPPSPTDGIVASDAVDRWLGELVGEAAGDAAFHSAYRGNRQLDLRALALTLDPGFYHVLRITMSLGDGAKTGALSFALPSPALDTSSVRDAPASTSRSVIADVSAEFSVDLVRFPLPLSEVIGLAKGALWTVPPERMGSAILRGIDGRDIAHVSLGRVAGRWAIRRQRRKSSAVELPSAAFMGLISGSGDAAVELSDPPVATSMADVAPPVLTELAPLPDLALETSRDEMPALPELPDLPDLPDLPPLTSDGS